MIPARNFPLGQYLVWRMIDYSLRKHFDRILLRVHDKLADKQNALPMIFCANHSSWWDGYAAALVKRQLDIDGYLMMEEEQLRRYFFFTWMGCFSVNRQNPRSAIQSLQYATHLLKERPGRMVWLFPQGEISPNDRRPLVFFTGAAYLARMVSPVLVYPVATRIEYLAEQRPDLFISISEPWQISADDARAPGFIKDCTRNLEELVTAELDRLRSDVLAGNYEGFTQAMRGRASTNRVFDALLLRKQIGR